MVAVVIVEQTAVVGTILMTLVLMAKVAKA